MANTNPPPPQAAPWPWHSKIVRITAMVLLALIILVSLAVLIIWLTVKPKRLIYTIEDGSIHGYNLTNNQLKANFDFVLRAYNPNTKVSIYYDKMEVSVYYDDQTVAFDSVSPFFQPHRNVTRLGLKLVAKDVTLFQSAAKDTTKKRGYYRRTGPSPMTLVPSAMRSLATGIPVANPVAPMVVAPCSGRPPSVKRSLATACPSPMGPSLMTF